MDRCPNCPAEYDPIEGSGPRQCDLLGIGERPGSTENQRGRVFCGKTGDELDYTYLPLAGIHRPEIRLENLVRCWAFGNRTPTEKEVESCANHFLPRVLNECKPKVVILMGGSAHRIVDVPSGGKRMRVDMTHGRPVWGSLLNRTWEGWIWSSYHPALGMHDTAKMSDLLDDFDLLGEWLKGEWQPPQPQQDIKKDYYLIETLPELVNYLRDATVRQLFTDPKLDSERRFYLATDTERHGSDPWSLQFSPYPHSARMLSYQRGDPQSASLFAELSRWIKETRANIILHNAGQDLDAMERMGVWAETFDDTQQQAFQLSLPQGLKTLAYRLLGVEMSSWEDTVWPASVEAVSSWLVDAIDLVSGKLQDIEVTEMMTYTCAACGHRAHPDNPCKSKAGGRTEKCGCDDGGKYSNKKYEYRPSAIEKVFRHVLTYTSKTVDADEPYNPWKKLPEMVEEGLRGAKPEKWEMEWVEEELGPMPILGIGNCSLDEAVQYGNSDADMTGQVASVLAERRQDDRWKIAEGDYDQ